MRRKFRSESNGISVQVKILIELKVRQKGLRNENLASSTRMENLD